MIDENDKVAVIGLGYVGLPLAVEFGRIRATIGFDIHDARIHELKAGRDRTGEVKAADLAAAHRLDLTSDPETLAAARVYIVTVPTPIDRHKRPDLSPLTSASRLVGQFLSPGDIVIYESTVYPGATEEICVPELERSSNLVLNEDFFVGYSPERINPGDTEHRLTTITKITSGSTPAAAEAIDCLYKEIITAGTYPTGSIRVAEAAKVIENTQRDVNIALVNELALLFRRLDLDTSEVLAAAGTKWNFLRFQPGLVGGHCIGVDPYYLTFKAQEVGHHPEVILAGRRINDNMGTYVADQTVLLLAKKGAQVAGSRVLVLGLAFKENCPDVRNTRVIDIINRLQDYRIEVDVHDPHVSASDVEKEYGLRLAPYPTEESRYSAVILAVAHNDFIGRATEIRRLVGNDGVIFDIKAIWPRDTVDARL